MSSEVQIFGIRHHGPGSAKRLVEALDELQPEAVLIEGPSDISELLPLLADAEMELPVALLSYAVDNPSDAVFWPFAAFSPEYQAVFWAVRNEVAPRFIDLPASVRLRDQAKSEGAGEAGGDDAAEPAARAPRDPVAADPIGALARAAGYEDGESWWSDVIEENPSPGPIFTAVADAMTALRAEAQALDEHEAQREAHMRLAIADAAKQVDGPVAVVCGAWHVPALKERHTAKDDRALLKGLGKRKVAATWAPWTAPRLAYASGYGAGVVAPGWCRHVWQTGVSGSGVATWLAKIAAALRGQGHLVSTASLIEAERLARALAAIRDRPQPGFEECREAAIACLCFGETLVWEQIAAEVLVGADVGSIPTNVPLAPLLDDLQRQQKQARLKPEALDRELSLDLRSESGLFRSTLLHRLTALDVPWGKLVDADRSRGTFRERWVLRWEPEFAVQLVEHLVFGPTISEAANGRLSARIGQETHLGALAGLVQSAMTAQLDDAAEQGTHALGRRAAQTSDCGELLSAVPPMADVIRYGQARTGGGEQLGALMRRIVVQAAIALPYAARGLDNEAAAGLGSSITAAQDAVLLAEVDGDDLHAWYAALEAILSDTQATALIAGTVARLLYEADRLDAAAAADLVARRLTPGTSSADAAGFFEGFLSSAGQRLIYDGALRGAVDDWLCTLDEDDFVQNLPIFRRVFSVLDGMERKRLIDAVLGADETAAPGQDAASDGGARWAVHLQIITDILNKGASK